MIHVTGSVCRTAPDSSRNSSVLPTQTLHRADGRPPHGGADLLHGPGRAGPSPAVEPDRIHLGRHDDHQLVAGAHDGHRCLGHGPADLARTAAGAGVGDLGGDEGGLDGDTAREPGGRHPLYVGAPRPGRGSQCRPYCSARSTASSTCVASASRRRPAAAARSARGRSRWSRRRSGRSRAPRPAGARSSCRRRPRRPARQCARRRAGEVPPLTAAHAQVVERHGGSSPASGSPGRSRDRVPATSLGRSSGADPAVGADCHAAAEVPVRRLGLGHLHHRRVGGLSYDGRTCCPGRRSGRRRHRQQPSRRRPPGGRHPGGNGHQRRRRDEVRRAEGSGCAATRRPRPRCRRTRPRRARSCSSTSICCLSGRLIGGPPSARPARPARARRVT